MKGNRTWAKFLAQARRLPDSELRRHALVCLRNMCDCVVYRGLHSSRKGFTCAALRVLKDRHVELCDVPEKAIRVLEAMERIRLCDVPEKAIRTVSTQKSGQEEL